MDRLAVVGSAKSKVELDSCHCEGSISRLSVKLNYDVVFFPSWPSKWIDVELLNEA